MAITTGAEVEIDLSCFREPEPLFAYVDDVGCKVKPLSGLEISGKVTIENQPDFMWLKGKRDGVLLRATMECRQGHFASFRSLGIGEFCLEIYHVRPDQRVELLHQDDFAFK
jgi:hypothetical protein